MNTQPTAPSHLQPDHAKIVGKSIWPMLNYLVRLRERMEKTFPPTDPAYLDVCKAYDAVHALNVRLHYLSCKRIGEVDEESRLGAKRADSDLPPPSS